MSEGRRPPVGCRPQGDDVCLGYKESTWGRQPPGNVVRLGDFGLIREVVLPYPLATILPYVEGPLSY